MSLSVHFAGELDPEAQSLNNLPKVFTAGKQLKWVWNPVAWL